MIFASGWVSAIGCAQPFFNNFNHERNYMKNYISEGEAIYMDKNFGLFSKRLAEWAISNMETEDAATGEVKPLKSAPTLEETKELLKKYNVELPREFIYTAWYLHAMAMADYPKSLPSDEHRAYFIKETLCDVDGAPENVLACFVAKMCVAGVPIFWEEYL